MEPRRRNCMPDKEAAARIKINRMLEASGWRFFDDKDGPANISLEPGVTLKISELEELGENFEKAKRGFVSLNQFAA
jgi:type I restriction enzyme R subunit